MNKELKLFLFDEGIGVRKEEQTEERLTAMALDLIENNHVDVPPQLKQWYNSHRTFNIMPVYEDILVEMINQMNLNELEQFCKTNKHYQQYCGSLLSKKILQEQGLYLLEEPITYQDWVNSYKKSKRAIDKTNQILTLLNEERNNNDYYTPWLFLFIDEKNPEQFKLLEKYKYYYKEDIVRANKSNYNHFNLILNVDTFQLFYKYYLNGPHIVDQIIINVDIYDVLYRYFYFYPKQSDHLIDQDDLYFNIPFLINELPTLEDNIKEKALRRIHYLESY